MNYPKIDTLFNRDNKNFKVIEDEIRHPEFKEINTWWVTEKIHGMNIRVILEPVMEITGFISLSTITEDTGEDEITYTGRTDNAQLPGNLMKYLYNTFSFEKLRKQFPREEGKIPAKITLFGEGYGAKINGGGNYINPDDNNGFDTKFRLFDVFIEDYNNPLGGWWLEPENLKDVAIGLNIDIAPIIGIFTTEECVRFVKQTKKGVGISLTQAKDNPLLMDEKVQKIIPEGIVARTFPMLFTRRGRRVIFKLKVSDFSDES